MASDPETSLPADQPEQSDDDRAKQRVITTQGGDYAEGTIDKRQGTFIAGNQFVKIYQAPRESSPAFQVPYPPIPLIGRDADLAELAERLMGDVPLAVPLAIVGMGGIGKTLLAATFAHRHQAAFPGGVFWLNMDQPDVIESQVAACAGPGGLDLPDFPALSFAERIARVQAAWNSPTRRLLVLDNLEDPAVLTRWQPRGSGTRVVITTRRDDWPRQVQRLRLPVLARPRSIDLLLAARMEDQDVPLETLLAAPSERRAADTICELLGDLPLALAIAAALLRLTPSLRLHDFADQIGADPLLDGATPDMGEALREAGLPTGRAQGVAATFALSYRQLLSTAALDAAALRMLHAAAYCAPTPLPQEVLWQVADLDPASAAGQQAGDAAIRLLRTLGLIAVSTAESASTVTLHRLLAAFVRQQPHPPELLATTATILAQYTTALQDAGQIKRSLVLVPHLEAVLAHQTDAQGAEHPDTLATAHNLASTLSKQGDYAAARTRHEAVLAVRTRLLGPEHPTTLATAHTLASTLSKQGDYAAARTRYEAVLAVRTRLLGPEHPDTLSTAHNLAVTLSKQGDYAAARTRYEAVLAVRTRLLGPEHPDTLSTAHNLAVTLSKQGDYAAARTRYEAVLAVRTRLLGPEHPDTLATANNLASTLSKQGDYAAARTRYEAVLAVRTRLLGPEHPTTLSTAHNLAVTLSKQGDYAAARTRYEAVLAVRTRLLGPEHPATLSTANNLALTLDNQGDYAAARTRYEAVLAVRTRLLGPEHPATLSTAHNLALTLSKQGDYAAARTRYEAVLAVRTRLLGPEHPDTLSTAHNLALTLFQQGDYAAARTRYEAVLAVRTRLLGPEHPDTLATAHNLAVTLFQQGDYAAARTRYEAVLAVRTRLLGPEHPDTLATAHNLALTLFQQGDYAAARTRYEVVLAVQMRVLGSEHPATLSTARTLALLDSHAKRRWWQFWRRAEQER